MVAVGVTCTPVPEGAWRGPGVITPVPLGNTPVRVAVAPGPMVAGLALKLVMVGTFGAEVCWNSPANMLQIPLAEPEAWRYRIGVPTTSKKARPLKVRSRCSGCSCLGW